MHRPMTHEVVSEKGITGRARGRRQLVTGKPVLQVEVVLEKKTITAGVQVTACRYETAWRDATLSEAFQVEHGVGFIEKPADIETPFVKPPPPPAPPRGN